MATVQRSSIGDLHDQISITLTKEDYLPKFENTLKKYSKTANIPGFRKGQVPTGMIKKMYGQSVFVDEVLRAAYSEVENYIKTENPQLLGQPIPMESDTQQKLDMNNPDSYTFNFEIGLKPEFTVKAIDEKATLTKYTIAITEEMLDKEIEEIRKRAGKLEDKEAQDSDNDLIYISLKKAGEEDAEELNDLFEFKVLPKELKEKLSGAKKDLSFEFSLSQVADAEEKENFLKGATDFKKADENATYNLTVTRVAGFKMRDLDEAFFNDVFPGKDIKDEAGFRAELKTALAQQLDRYSVEKLNNDIFETLVHTTEIKLPETFLRKWLKVSGEKPKTDEEVDKEWSTFDHQLRWTLIFDQLVQKYGIQVSYDEVMQDIRARVSAYFGIPAGEDVPWMESYLNKMAKEEQTINETHRRLMTDKLFEAVRKDLNIVEKEVSDEEFAKIPALYHHND